MRMYNLLPNWMVLSGTPDFVIGADDDPYLKRYFVIPRNRWANIYLHQFLKSDDPRALHDHPWLNCSILLIGSYLEHTPGGIHLRRPWRPWAFWRLPMRRAASAHRIELIASQRVWTLFLTGPVIREWGFLCPQGWRHWKEFVTQRPGGNAIGPGCD